MPTLTSEQSHNILRALLDWHGEDFRSAATQYEETLQLIADETDDNKARTIAVGAIATLFIRGAIAEYHSPGLALIIANARGVKTTGNG